MSPVRKLERFTLPLTVGAIRVELSGLYRDGTGTPLVFLHGFGSTKEDYADVIQHERLAAHPVLAYDAPGPVPAPVQTFAPSPSPSSSPSPNRSSKRGRSNGSTSSDTPWSP